jgi:hypothetical protein
MNDAKMLHALRVSALVLVATFSLAGCAKKPAADQTAATMPQTTFASAEEAAGAFVAALKRGDSAELAKLLGPDTKAVLSSGDPVADQRDREWFVTAYDAKHALEPDGADKMTITVGDDAWPMPIPIVRRDGKWYLDGAAGADELVYRRVGRNELGAIAVCRGFVAAQQEYASEGRDGDPKGIYAMKLISDDGMHNGLYWHTGDDEPPSPAGPFVASAASEGYRRAEGGARTPYHGYYYRMLYKQGANANGGAREYFKDGLLTEGFALVAWPAEYGASGVMTFLVNQDGVVFQKDLGADTSATVDAMNAFDPDSSWTAIAPPAEEQPPAPPST